MPAFNVLVGSHVKPCFLGVTLYPGLGMTLRSMITSKGLAW